MANGSDHLWKQQLAKNGPWALGCTVLCTAFYMFALQPMAHERTLFIQVLQESVQENTKSWKTMAQSTKTIAETVIAQQDSMMKLQDIVKVMAEDTITSETRVAIEEFIEEMLRVHPEHSAKLDNILEMLRNGKS